MSTPMKMCEAGTNDVFLWRSDHGNRRGSGPGAAGYAPAWSTLEWSSWAVASARLPSRVLDSKRWLGLMPMGWYGLVVPIDAVISRISICWGAVIFVCSVLAHLSDDPN